MKHERGVGAKSSGTEDVSDHENLVSIMAEASSVLVRSMDDIHQVPRVDKTRIVGMVSQNIHNFNDLSLKCPSSQNIRSRMILSSPVVITRKCIPTAPWEETKRDLSEELLMLTRMNRLQILEHQPISPTDHHICEPEILWTQIFEEVKHVGLTLSHIQRMFQPDQVEPRLESLLIDLLGPSWPGYGVDEDTDIPGDACSFQHVDTGEEFEKGLKLGLVSGSEGVLEEVLGVVSAEVEHEFEFELAFEMDEVLEEVVLMSL